VNPESFQKIDRTIHEAGRMTIMALLAASPDLAFTEVRDTLNMTDGNLSVHLRTLQEAGYVAVTKSYADGRPRSTAALTAKGRQAFTEYINTLAEIVRQTQGS
jgi:DNA-binding MarR family transcriptional regulator